MATFVIRLTGDEISTVTRSLDVRAESWASNAAHDTPEVLAGALALARLADKIREQCIGQSH